MEYKKIKTYINACKVKGIKPKSLSDFAFLPKDEREIAFFNHQRITIADAIKKGLPAIDWNNRNQTKWEAIFQWDYETSRFGFWCSDFTYTRTITFCGSRLNFPDKASCDYFGKNFSKIHNKALTL